MQYIEQKSQRRKNLISQQQKKNILVEKQLLDEAISDSFTRRVNLFSFIVKKSNE